VPLARTARVWAFRRVGSRTWFVVRIPLLCTRSRNTPSAGQWRAHIPTSRSVTYPHHVRRRVIPSDRHFCERSIDDVLLCSAPKGATRSQAGKLRLPPYAVPGPPAPAVMTRARLGAEQSRTSSMGWQGRCWSRPVRGARGRFSAMTVSDVRLCHAADLHSGCCGYGCRAKSPENYERPSPSAIMMGAQASQVRRLTAGTTRLAAQAG
jgi:hypothetical protein